MKQGKENIYNLQPSQHDNKVTQIHCGSGISLHIKPTSSAAYHESPNQPGIREKIIYTRVGLDISVRTRVGYNHAFSCRL